MWQKCGKITEEQIKYLDTIIGKYIEELIPVIHKYILWSAEHSTGFFDSGNISMDFSQDKMEFANDFYSSSVNHMKNIANEEAKGDEWSKIVKLINLPETGLLYLYQAQPQVKEISKNIKQQIKTILESKSLLSKNLKKLELIIEERLTTRLSANDAATFLIWAEEVIIEISKYCRLKINHI